MIYVKALWRYSIEQIDEGFSRALHECTPFMPKIADIETRMPETREYFEPDSAAFVPVKDWYEPFTETAKLHIWEDARGHRRVGTVKLKDGERPPRVAAPRAEETISWEEAKRQIAAMAGKEFKPGMRYTAEDGWQPREVSWKLEQEREAKKQRPAAWHAPIKGPRIKP